jgi:hypothetical protein
MRYAIVRDYLALDLDEVWVSACARRSLPGGRPRHLRRPHVLRDPWAVQAAAAGLLDGIVDMGPDFDFWVPATRAEVCLLLANLLDQ